MNEKPAIDGEQTLFTTFSQEAAIVSFRHIADITARAKALDRVANASAAEVIAEWGIEHVEAEFDEPTATGTAFSPSRSNWGTR